MMEPAQTQFSLLNRKLSEISERVRLLEERSKDTLENLHIVDETMERRTKNLKDSISDIRKELIQIRNEITQIRSILRRVISDLSNAARKSDVRVIEKYIELLDPTNLVTRDDVERIVEEKMKEVK